MNDPAQREYFSEYNQGDTIKKYILTHQNLRRNPRCVGSFVSQWVVLLYMILGVLTGPKNGILLYHWSVIIQYLGEISVLGQPGHYLTSCCTYLIHV